MRILIEAAEIIERAARRERLRLLAGELAAIAIITVAALIVLFVVACVTAGLMGATQ